jgi:hypothetical protein
MGPTPAQSLQQANMKAAFLEQMYQQQLFEGQRLRQEIQKVQVVLGAVVAATSGDGQIVLTKVDFENFDALMCMGVDIVADGEGNVTVTLVLPEDPGSPTATEPEEEGEDETPDDQS